MASRRIREKSSSGPITTEKGQARDSAGRGGRISHARMRKRVLTSSKRLESGRVTRGAYSKACQSSARLNEPMPSNFQSEIRDFQMPVSICTQLAL